MTTRVPDVGDAAPLFTAPGTGDVTYDLSSYRGRPVVLVFYPGDATPICTQQLTGYNRGLGKLTALDATVLAISPQSVASHEEFRSTHGFEFPLLYDEGKRIGELYGVVGALGFYRRSVFVVDADGIVRFASRSSPGFTYPDVDTIADAVGNLPSP